MKTLEIKQMEAISGGTNRQCMIDGALTILAVGVGVAAGGFLGGAAAAIGGLFAANSNGCF
jgi:hypothetical protein